MSYDNPLEIKPQMWLPISSETPEYGLENLLYNETTPRGKRWLSNRYNFLLNMMKFIPRAESEIYSSNYEDGTWAPYEFCTSTNVNTTAGHPFTTIFTGSDFTDACSGAGFERHGTDLFNALKNLGYLDSNGLLNVQKYKNQIYRVYKDELIAGEEFSRWYGGLSDYDKNKLASAIWDKLGSGPQHDPVGQPGFGKRHSQSSDDGVVDFLGAGKGSEFPFNFTPAFWDFNPVKETDTRVDFLVGKGDLSKNQTAYGMRNDGSIVATAFPVYAASEDATDQYTYLLNNSGGDYKTTINNYHPVDYNNFFYGSNPAMLRNWDGPSGTELSKLDLPNLADYSSSFTNAESFFNGYSSNTDYSKFNGDQYKVGAPSFYELAMDPSAPWNFDNRYGDKAYTNPNNCSEDSWWTTGREPNFESQAAFNIAVLLLESRRRYFAGMTELFGPHSQYYNMSWYSQNIGLNNIYNGASDDKPTTTYNGSLDNAMIKSFDKWMGDYHRGDTESSADPWTGKESGDYNKTFLQTFSLAQHRLSQWIMDFGPMSGNSLGGGWYSTTDYYRLSNFRSWLSTNLTNYYNNSPMKTLHDKYTSSGCAGASVFTPSTTPPTQEQKDTYNTYTTNVNAFITYYGANKNELKLSTYYLDADKQVWIPDTSPAGGYWIGVKTAMDALTADLPPAETTTTTTTDVTTYTTTTTTDPVTGRVTTVTTPVTTPVTTSTTGATMDAAKLRDYATKINKYMTYMDPAFDEFKGELTYTDTSTATHSRQPASFWGGRSWDTTAGNFISNIGVFEDDNSNLAPAGASRYSYNINYDDARHPYGSKPSDIINNVYTNYWGGGNPPYDGYVHYASSSDKQGYGYLSGQHHFYSIGQQINNLNVMNLNSAMVRINVEMGEYAKANFWRGTINAYGGYDNPGGIQDYGWTAVQASKYIWMTHEVGALYEAETYGFMNELMGNNIVNSQKHREYERKMQEYKEGKKEKEDDERDDKKTAAKQENDKKQQNNASFSALMKKIAQQRQSGSKQKSK
ncbi:MAG: hypothetical protein NTZ10_03765 [Candidatus Saganbacteria bacterium]|nr:hypothetical protein [Candidatus Saganbacteria bacterium]